MFSLVRELCGNAVLHDSDLSRGLGKLFDGDVITLADLRGHADIIDVQHGSLRHARPQRTALRHRRDQTISSPFLSEWGALLFHALACTP